MTFSLLRVVACFAVVVGGHIALAAEPAIIAKARAAIAPDAVLDGVKTLHYVGTISAASSAEPGKTTEQKIEIFLEKPARQRIVVSSSDAIEVSALNGYEAWRRTTNAKDTTQWQQSQMSVEQIKQLRADVWQNLSFFRGIETLGGRVDDLGDDVVDGIQCRKLAFIHDDKLNPYIRFFDKNTGRLLMTGTPQNNIREEGEIVAGGIRFPKHLVITREGGDQKITQRITFDKITVNERFDPSLFAVPLPTLK